MFGKPKLVLEKVLDCREAALMFGELSTGLIDHILDEFRKAGKEVMHLSNGCVAIARKAK